MYINIHSYTEYMTDIHYSVLLKPWKNTKLSIDLRADRYSLILQSEFYIIYFTSNLQTYRVIYVVYYSILMYINIQPYTEYMVVYLILDSQRLEKLTNI